MWRVKHRPPPPAKYVTQAVGSADILEKVQATGAVQPLLQVNIGAQVNGRVTRVAVDFNSVVKKGDVLAEIDPKILGTQVFAQQSNLLQQRAQLEQARAQMETSRAQMDMAKVTLDRTDRLFTDSLGGQGGPRHHPRAQARREVDVRGFGSPMSSPHKRRSARSKRS